MRYLAEHLRPLGGYWSTLAVLAGLAIAGALRAGGQGKDYGPLEVKDNFTGTERFWTGIDKDGVTAWRRAAEDELKLRGFSESQIKKFVRLRLRPIDNKSGIGDYDRGQAGTVKLTVSSLPMRFNSETGEAMPFDPIEFARAIPGCYAKDERSCTLKYSTQMKSVADQWRPCLLPRRTVNFCKSTGFVQMKRAHGSCGEEQRGNGCGADMVVFDDGNAQTKLAFDVAQLSATSAAPKGDGGAVPASPAPGSPKIVYHGDKHSAFKSREGARELEEWEYDTKLYLASQKRAERANFSEELTTQNRRLFEKPLQYCWPHDVFHPCDLE